MVENFLIFFKSMNLIISNCTNRKSSQLEKISPHASMYQIEDADQFIAQWFDQLKKNTIKNHAISVYKGRSVSEIIQAKGLIKSEVIFISAGLGVVREDDLIPNYDLTISDGRHSLKPLFAKWSIDEAAWWEKLVQHSSHQDYMNEVSGYLFIAVPQNYLKMILPSLMSLSPKTLSKLRLFLHPASLRSVPEKLKPYYMPYSYKIENSDMAGTKVDYCQRCLHHFIQHIHTADQDFLTATELVKQFIQALPLPPPKVKRLQVNDDEIKQLILEGWDNCQGHSSKLLRYLRDDKKTACEQSRFQKLWRVIKDGKQNECE